MQKTLFFLIISMAMPAFAQQPLKELLDQENENTVPYVYTEELAALEGNIILLDAREKREYEVSHLKGAIMVGYDYFNLKKTMKQLPDKNDTIVVYCSLGIRSEDIAEKLKKKGYKNVFNLYGGIFEWKNNNHHVVTKDDKVTERVHTFDQYWGQWLKKGEKVYE